MLTLLTTTTLIPLLLTRFPPTGVVQDAWKAGHGWETRRRTHVTRLVSGPGRSPAHRGDAVGRRRFDHYTNLMNWEGYRRRLQLSRGERLHPASKRHQLCPRRLQRAVIPKPGWRWSSSTRSCPASFRYRSRSVAGTNTEICVDTLFPRFYDIEDRTQKVDVREGTDRMELLGYRCLWRAGRIQQCRRCTPTSRRWKTGCATTSSSAIPVLHPVRFAFGEHAACTAEPQIDR